MPDRALPGFVLAFEVGVVVLDPGVDFLEGAAPPRMGEEGLGD